MCKVENIKKILQLFFLTFNCILLENYLTVFEESPVELIVDKVGEKVNKIPKEGEVKKTNT